MEANDLESFFLSKDKKKKSKKTYVINPALLIEQTREAELKKAKKVNEKSQQSQEPKSDLLRKTKEDDEWEDTADVEVDITNLRIGMMPQKVEEVKPKIEISNEYPSDDSDSESITKKLDKSAHPWGNKVIIKTEFESAAISEQCQSQKYIPPSMRSGDSKQITMNPIKRAPNITNNAEFPSLREVVDVDPEDGTWCRVIKNGHTQSTEQTNTKKYIPPAKRDNFQPEVQPVSSSKKVEKIVPVKYVPPHLRNKQNVNPSENRFASLKDESTN